MAPASPSLLPTTATVTWRVDPSVLTWRWGHELVAYHLRTGRSYRLPDLPPRVRELLELGGELEFASSPAPPSTPGAPGSTGARDSRGAPSGAEGDEQARDGLDEILHMLMREKLIERAGGAEGVAAKGAAAKNESGELFLIISAPRTGSMEPGHSDGRAAPLQASTVLQRAPKLVIELVHGRTRVSAGDPLPAGEPPRQGFSGGTFTLRLLDAFEHPRTVYEVVRVLQGRVREAQGWIGLVEALVGLFEAGVLRDVKQEAGRDRYAYAQGSFSPP